MQESDANRPGKIRAGWNEVKTLYRYELRSALREKAIVINSILIPIFLYPLIMWAAFTGLVFVQGQSEKTASRVAISHFPSEHPGLRMKLEREKKIQIIRDKELSAADRIQKGSLDAFLEFLPAQDDAAKLDGNFKARITFNASKDRSVEARRRIESVISDYRTDWLKREAKSRGINAETWSGFSIDQKNVASEKQMGGFILGIMLPVLFVVMVAMGCFYPAIDCTAGERERNTWETLMSSAASRVNIVLAKYLYVTTLGGLAGALNLTAFALTLKPIFAPLLGKAGVSIHFGIPLTAIPLLIVAAVLLAGFVAAGMMIFASFARTFKEGQAMIMPFYLLVMMPPIFLQTPGLKFSLALSFVPVVNVTLMVRSLVSGIFPWLQIGVTIAVSVILILACVRLAAFILKFEDVMLGSYSGSWKRFVKERVLRRQATAEQMK
ncbi:MAG: ABC transporter permease [Akkermansiaceae bacterium]|nr:ABC transporter permease [Verrucomicrobiales bacterium]